MYTVYMYHGLVIASFADEATEDLYNGVNTKAARNVDNQVWPVVARKLDMLNAATSPNDLKGPGNQLEKLKKALGGYWSIRVNDQYRIVFRFEKGNALEVRCRDIH